MAVRLILVALFCGAWSLAAAGQAVVVNPLSFGTKTYDAWHFETYGWYPIVGGDPGPGKAYNQTEIDSVMRAVSYWNEVITTVSGGTRTVYFDKHYMAAPAAAHATSAHVSFSDSSTWHPDRNTQIKTQNYSMESVVIHELAHSLGITGSATYGDGTNGGAVGQVRWTSLTGGWTRHLADASGTKLTANVWYNASAAYTFIGPNAMAVYGAPVPVYNGTSSGSSFVHTAIPHGNMNYAFNSTTRPFFTEVELAVMQDIGHTIDIRNFFGKSIYQPNTTLVNTTPWVGNGSYGIGLHLVSGGNTVNQNASLKSNGWAGAGIRIEAQNNTVQINGGAVVSATGEEGVGVLITHATSSTSQGASSTTLINRGVIEATGVNGRGVWFNAGTDQPFDNSGTINAQRMGGGLNDAIFTSSGATVSRINLMRGSDVLGNIVSNSGSNTTLTFGQAMDSTTGKSLGTSGAGSFDVSVAGNINGRFTMETWGGTTTVYGSVNTPSTSTTVGMGTANSTLVLVNSTNEFFSLQVNALGTLQLGNGGTTGNYTGTITTNGGTIAFNRSDTVTFNHATSNTSYSLKQAGPGTLIVDTNRALLGTTVDGGTLQLGSGGTTGMVSGNILNHGNVTFNRSDSFAYGNVISGLGTVTKIGANTLTLTGANSYGGGTLVQAGTLNLGTSPSPTVTYAGTGAVTLSSGATVQNYGRVISVVHTGGTINNGGRIDELTYWDGSYNSSYNSTVGNVGTLILAAPLSGSNWGTVAGLAFHDSGLGAITIAAPSSGVFSGIAVSTIDFSFGNITFNLGFGSVVGSDWAVDFLDLFGGEVFALAPLFGAATVFDGAELNSFVVNWGGSQYSILSGGMFATGWGFNAGFDGFVYQIPEPATLTFLLGLAGVGLVRRHRR